MRCRFPGIGGARGGRTRYALAWRGVSVYVLVAIVKKRLNLSASLYEMLQILSLTMFERIPLDQLLTKLHTDQNIDIPLNQLNLFD